MSEIFLALTEEEHQVATGSGEVATNAPYAPSGQVCLVCK